MSAVSLPQPRKGLRVFVESKGFNHAVTALIIINAITLGLETSQTVMTFAAPLLYFIDRTALIIFTIEISLRIWVYRANYFKDFWGIFDFLVVAIAWIPASGPLSVLRALRILRVLRLVSIVPQMRKVVGALLHSLPGMGSIVAVLLLVFYVGAVMATKLFGADFPDWFGSIGASMYTLFQIMTLESWSMGIVRPVMQEYPLAWLFFVPFIIVTSFAVLNLFIALVVNSMQSLHDQTTESVREEALIAHDEREALQHQLARISDDLEKIRAEVARR
ncbi:MAG: ion transporter [Woeseiaceae bacterium]|nr:ion transporter [Woeseiaceae bacterium]